MNTQTPVKWSKPHPDETKILKGYRQFIDLYIYKSGKTDAEMARIFGCSQSGFYKIRTGQRKVKHDQIRLMVDSLKLNKVALFAAIELFEEPQLYFSTFFIGIVESAVLIIEESMSAVENGEQEELYRLISTMSHATAKVVAGRLLKHMIRAAVAQNKILEGDVH